MGAQPGEIEREIEEQRQHVGNRITELVRRLDHDARQAQSVAQRQAARMRPWHLRDLATGALGLGIGLGVWYLVSRRGSSKDRQRVILMPLGDVEVDNRGGGSRKAAGKALAALGKAGSMAMPSRQRKPARRRRSRR